MRERGARAPAAPRGGPRSSEDPRAAYTRWLRYDPRDWLLSSRDEAVDLFVRRDLLGEPVDVTRLWGLPEPARLLRRQRSDGAWSYPARRPGPQNHDLLETFRSLGVLVAKYGFDRRSPAIEKAAAYVFSCQAGDGDYRGIYGSQPSHTYTPALMELLIHAGYARHASIARAFRWLLATRQEDGGWAIPARTRDRRLVRDWPVVMSSPPVEPDRRRPFSHLVTGMVLRAFAADPRRRRARAAVHAGQLVDSRILRADPYPDRGAAAYWTRFSYPFWFTDLVSALDSLGRLGFSADAPGVALAARWLASRQRRDGSFELLLLRGSDRRLPWWLGLAICRALARFRSVR